MDRNREEHSMNTASCKARNRGELVRGMEKWFHRFQQEEQVERETKLRLEEQRKERARIARELHDTLFQGFLGASLQVHDAVDRMPANSPSKPSLNRALLLMQRAIDEGRETLVGIHSSGVASMSLEQALSELREEFTPNGGVGF